MHRPHHQWGMARGGFVFLIIPGGIMTIILKALAPASLIFAGTVALAPQPAAAGLFSAPKLPAADAIAVPKPIEGNSGKYMSPFTSDGVTAEWVTKAMKVGAAGSIGSAAGAYAGQQVLNQVPFVGGLLGKKLGNTAGRAIALKSIGGEAFLKNTSDLSFNDGDALLIYVYAKYSTHAEYAKILDATYSIYPELKERYLAALLRAPLK